MKSDLKKMNRKELEKLRADVDKALDRLTKSEKKEALDAVKKTAAQYGFSPEELLSTGAGKKSAGSAKAAKSTKTTTPGKPKYRNPENAEQTWTGKGRPPAWFTAATNAGTSRESMEIKG